MKVNVGKNHANMYINTRYKNILLHEPHYKSELSKKIKEFSPQLIKNSIVKKYPTSQLQLIWLKN